MADAAKVTSNMIWRLMERFGAQGISFIISIVLARLLDPTVYGLIALVNIFISVFNVFVDCGLGNALIQKKDADDLDFSSVFYFNIIFSLLLYASLFFTAPFIAAFYKEHSLVLIIRIMSISLIISGIKNTQIAYIAKNLQFKKFFFATLGGTIGAAIIGITMAYKGYGVWALIMQNLFNSIVDTLILYLSIHWQPKLKFSFSRLHILFQYGYKLLLSGLIDTIFNKLQQLIIGKMYTKEELALYNKGDMLPQYIIININASIDSVLLPIMSSVQDNISDLKAITRRSIKTSTYIIMPMLVGLAVCATPLINVILTEKWLPCVPFLRIFCFTYAFWPIHTANLNAIKALGRSDLFLKLEIAKKTINIIVLLSTMWFGVMAMAYSLLFTSIASQIINSWPNKKLLNYNYFEQLKDIMPQIGLSLFMGIIVYCIHFVNLPDIITLIIQIPLGVVIYIVGSKIFKIDSYEYTRNIIKQLMSRVKKNDIS